MSGGSRLPARPFDRPRFYGRVDAALTRRVLRDLDLARLAGVPESMVWNRLRSMRGVSSGQFAEAVLRDSVGATYRQDRLR